DNADAINTVVPTFLCPSMVMKRQIPDTVCNEGGAPGSYGASMGTSNFAEDGLFSAYAGLTAPRKVKFRDITDGTSNTIMCGEFNMQLEDYLWSGFTCGAKAGQSRWGAHRWAVGYPGVSLGHTGGDFNVNLSVNRATWRSDHVGGAHFLLADGATRFVSESVDAETLDALATRAGEEEMADF
ncbi:MAG: DUF1559 family PulG-like putative transporter, partial [Planctomycetales bacterium]